MARGKSASVSNLGLSLPVTGASLTSSTPSWHQQRHAAIASSKSKHDRRSGDIGDNIGTYLSRYEGVTVAPYSLVDCEPNSSHPQADCNMGILF